MFFQRFHFILFFFVCVCRKVSLFQWCVSIHVCRLYTTQLWSSLNGIKGESTDVSVVKILKRERLKNWVRELLKGKKVFEGKRRSSHFNAIARLEKKDLKHFRLDLMLYLKRGVDKERQPTPNFENKFCVSFTNKHQIYFLKF